MTPAAGAFACFEGVVRNESAGKSALRLEYEIFDSLAVKEGNAVLAEAKTKFSVISVKCVHRSGTLAIGEMAVWVGVVAGHRDDAFKACRYIIDEVKSRVPIFKKEYYTNGDSGWVGVPEKSEKSIEQGEREYYSRQLPLSQVGESGQKKLKSARVLVVGAGGLGCPALLYLASAGVGTIGICEHDVLETSNLHRQVMYSHNEVGKPKVELAAARIKALNPFIDVRTHAVKLSPESAESIINGYDLLLDCTDNFTAKFLLNDAAVICKIPLIQASVYQFEGQVLFYRATEDSACLRCLWPQVPDPACVGNCATVGVLGVAPGLLGTIQASEAIKFILGMPDVLHNEILIVDLNQYRTKRLIQSKDPACPVCGQHPSITTIDAKHYLTASFSSEIDVTTLSIQEFSNYDVVDVREPVETILKPVKGIISQKIPSSKFDSKQHLFDKSKKYLVFCEKGTRSSRIVLALREQGFSEVYSIKDGADALKRYLKECLSKV